MPRSIFQKLGFAFQQIPDGLPSEIVSAREPHIHGAQELQVPLCIERPAETAVIPLPLYGEHLESSEFQAPARGGIRMLLVATDKSKGPATNPDAPAVSGQVAIAGQSILLGANAVHSLTLLAVRKYDASGNYDQEVGQQLYP